MAQPIHTRIFDAGQGYGAITGLRTLVDCTVVKREKRWWMYLCGAETGSHEIDMFSASLPEGAPLSATGWSLTARTDDPTRPALLAGKSRSHWWDGAGGRHCVSYARGWDPRAHAWVDRLYYAGAARDFMGPYAIGYLEWDDENWLDQEAPVFTANEYWERGSVYEPNLIYDNDRWKLWYVAGANQDDYLVQGYAESPDGRTKWSHHRIVFPPEDKVFDFCPARFEHGYEAVFARVNVSGAELPKTGLWWCEAEEPSPDISRWSEPIRISGPGPWKPVLLQSETDPNRRFVFHDNQYPNTTGRGIPIHFTVDCLEFDRQSLPKLAP